MRSITKPLLVVALLLTAAPAQAADTESLKRDLVGHAMGGRHKCWHFQNEAQIRDLEVLDENSGGNERTYTIRCTLQDPRVTSVYEAEAIVRYRRTDSTWRVESVGLLSMVKVQPDDR